MTMIKNVYETIDGYRDEVIALQAALTSRPALGPENGGTGEHEKTAYIKGLIQDLNPDNVIEIHAPDNRSRDGYRPNILATWGDVESRPAVWVLSHSDIVPPGDLALWDGDPYEIRVDGDRITGRGVEDNQHGFVSAYLALKAVMHASGKTVRPVGLAVVADEETGSRYGLAHILKTRGDIFKKGDLIVVPDAGNETGTMIEVAEKSMLWLKFTITGSQCHASTPEKGKNSLFGAARLIVELKALNEAFGATDPLFKPPVSTFSPTKMEANVPNVNTIPGRDVFYVDCRILPEYSVDRVVRAAAEIAKRVEAELGLTIGVDPVHREDAAEPTPPDAPVVTALTEAVYGVTGKRAEPMGIGGGTVAAHFRKAGLPAAVWCTQGNTAHQPNEYALISDILSDAKVFAALYMMDDRKSELKL